MGKSTRKKREKKKDFQKVKIKVGKKLPKADNFTNTSFKSRGILVKEQLKKTDDAEPVTKRKQNITDLLVHVNHYNSRVRETTLTELKSLLLENPQLVDQHLSLLVDNIAVIFTDKDENVRNAGYAIISIVTSNISTNHITPFFPVLCAHLCCAMTHIQEEIQLDSLKILDLFIQSYPELIISKSHELLTNFVLQISCQRNNVGGSTKANLSSAPSSKLAHRKWRLKVLERLSSFLSAILTSLEEKTPDISRKMGNLKSIPVTGEEQVNFQVLPRDGISLWLQQGFTLRSLEDNSSPASRFISNPSEIKSFIDTVVPLLLQSWIEAAPGIYGKHNPGTTLPGGAIEMLGEVASVLNMLWKWLNVVCKNEKENEVFNDLCSSYKKKFIQSLFVGFPYDQIDGLPLSKKEMKKKRQKEFSVTPLELNLSLCELMSHFVSNSKERWNKTLIDFICDTSETETDLAVESYQVLLAVIKKLVGLFLDQETQQAFINAAITLYHSAHPLSQSKQITLNYLADMIFLNKNATSVTSTNSPTSVIKSIPSLLLVLKASNPVASHNALEVLCKAASTGSKEATDCIQENLLHLIDPIQGILCDFPVYLQKKVVELVHYMPKLSREHFKVLANVCNNNAVSSSCVVYGIQILSSKLLKNYSNLNFDMSDFISFLFTLSVGSSQDSLVSERPVDPVLSPFCITRSQLNELKRTHGICKCVCQTFNMISSRSQVWDLFQWPVRQLLENHQPLSARTVYGLLTNVSHLCNNNTMDESFESSFLPLLITVLYTTVQDASIIFVENGWEETLWKISSEILFKLDKLFRKVLIKMSGSIIDLKETEHIRIVSLVIIRLLQTDHLKVLVRESVVELQKFLHNVEISPYAPKETRWLAELRYEVGLV